MRRHLLLALATSLLTLAADTPDRAHAQELDFTMGRGGGVSGGLLLGRQAVLHLGASASFSGNQSQHPEGELRSSYWAGGPTLALKLYLRNMDAALAPDASAADRVVPLLRLGAAYHFGRGLDSYGYRTTSHSVGGFLTGGVGVVVHPRVILTGEVGVGVQRTFAVRAEYPWVHRFASTVVSLGLTTRFGSGT
ncbi:MAG: hypothetical protein KF901_02380 [Myxococcales bacterium]|nr:hypothetical protein [Myxococcales bacterium]